MGVFSLLTSPAQPRVGASCVRKRFSHHTCDACALVCPVHAITLTSNAAVLNDANCIRCGHCLFVCPVDAVENIHTTQRKYRGMSLVAPLSSLAASVEELLMWHFQYGIRTVEIDIEAHSGWALTVAALNIRLKALGEPSWLLASSKAKHINVFRRHFIQFNEAEVLSANVIASPRLRRSTLQNIYEYGIVFDCTVCILCGACKRVCEDKAIQIDDGEMRLVSSRCTGCNNCAVACPTKAIIIKAKLGVCQPEIFAFTPLVCTDCNQEFTTFNSADKQCPTCQRHKYGMRKL